MIQASSDFGDDCERESTEENSSMLAFFDSLVQRDMSSGEDTENNDDSDSETVSLDENDLRFGLNIVHNGPENLKKSRQKIS